jgi:hypothetical protein
MIDKLLALKSLVTPDRSQPAHAELDHAHWDAATRTWRTHPQPAPEDADSAASTLNAAS